MNYSDYFIPPLLEGLPQISGLPATLGVIPLMEGVHTCSLDAIRIFYYPRYLDTSNFVMVHMGEGLPSRRTYRNNSIALLF